MQECLKRVITKTTSEWLQKIRESEESNTVIDIAYEFNKIFSINIITISCGNDNISDDLVTVMLPETPGSTKFVETKLPIRLALQRNFGLLAQ